MSVVGRVLEKRVVAFRCDVASCGVRVPVTGCRLPSTWHDQVADIDRLVRDVGWGFVLVSRLRSYCPVHAGRVWQCSCVTNPGYRHRCTVHNPGVRELVWTAEYFPDEVRVLLPGCRVREGVSDGVRVSPG